MPVSRVEIESDGSATIGSGDFSSNGRWELVLDATITVRSLRVSYFEPHGGESDAVSGITLEYAGKPMPIQISRDWFVFDEALECSPERPLRVRGTSTRGWFVFAEASPRDKGDGEVVTILSDGIFEYECPGKDCPACNGSVCHLCGAGLRVRLPDEPLCEHDGEERHWQPTGLRL